MKNYNRYLKTTTEQYDKTSFMYYLCKGPSDQKIIPLISKIKDKDILDVGLGTGFYSKILLENNNITGIDQNPHLCKLPVTVHKGDAAELTKLVQEKNFDIVFSTWMTEYLDSGQLDAFFAESKKVLKENGQLITTIISRYGMGFIYVTLAKILKGINKYNYLPKDVIIKLENAGFNNIKIIRLNSLLSVPWAYMVIAQ